jgi:hypothetical protein
MTYEVEEKREGRGSLSICTNINFQFHIQQMALLVFVC